MVDFAPVAVAQKIAAVAFERIVFEDVGLSGQMRFRIEIDTELVVAVLERDDLIFDSIQLGVGQAPQSFVRRRRKNQINRRAFLFAQTRREPSRMQAGLLGGLGFAFLQRAGGAVDHLDKANSLIARRIAALPFESQPRLGQIPRQRGAKGADLPRRTERARRR